MKFGSVISAVTFVLAAAASPAMAQDARDTHFNGPYVSGTIGMGAQNNDVGETVVFDTNRDGRYGDAVRTTTGLDAFSPAGPLSGFCHGQAGGNSALGGCGGDENHFEYSGRIGYDQRIGNLVGGNLVGGLLVEVSKSESQDFVTAFSNTPARYTMGRELDIAVAIRGRVGYTPGGGALFYATGGAAYAKIDHSFTTTNTMNAFTEVNDGKWVFGAQLGGGAEVMITDNVSLGIEYLFNRYHDNKYRVAVTQGSALATNPFLLQGGGTNMRRSDRNFEFHSLRAAVAFHF